jgi:hypothetical protein
MIARCVTNELTNAKKITNSDKPISRRYAQIKKTGSVVH